MLVGQLAHEARGRLVVLAVQGDPEEGSGGVLAARVPQAMASVGLREGGARADQGATDVTGDGVEPRRRAWWAEWSPVDWGAFEGVP